MASTSSPGHHTPSPHEEREEGLRSKRSSITIECSDGSKVIFVRPNRPRSGSQVAISHSHSPSPPPAAPGPGPDSGPSSKPGPVNRKKRERPHSMPAPAHLYDSDIHMSHSHGSLPAYLSGPCPECGHRQGHLDECTQPGSRLSEARLLDLVPMRADGEAHDSSIQQRAQQGRDPQMQSSIRSESRRPRTGRRASTNHPHAGSGSSRTPSPLHHGPSPAPRQVPARNERRDSDISSRARYSIEAVVGPVSPRSRSSRRRHQHRRNTFRFELREIGGEEANTHSRSRSHSTSPPHYFNANIRGGYGSGNYQAGGVDSSSRDSVAERTTTAMSTMYMKGRVLDLTGNGHGGINHSLIISHQTRGGKIGIINNRGRTPQREEGRSKFQPFDFLTYL
ncbi:hypothetical protein F4803DRAFT_555678 [Xylaria telfairii]|nr:hypothetical protein F4803DRAFT_555678 [Xylaria telfairii]